MLVPWSTIDRMFAPRRAPFGRAFDGFFPVFDKAATSTASSSGLEETEDAFIFSADLPGLSSDQLRVTFEGDLLTVSGERHFDAPEGYSPTRRERRHEGFERRLRFRTPVVAKDATADFTDGVLTIVIPKAEDAKPLTIQVT